MADLAKSSQGFVEGGVTSGLRGPRRDRPHAPYGEYGLVVEMHAIPGQTAKGLLKRPFVFQASPTDSFGVDGDAPHNDYMTIGDGEHSSPGSGPNLRTISFTTLFLDWQPIWTVLRKTGWVPDPQAFIRDLRAIYVSRRPIHLLVHQFNNRDSYEVDMAATLRSAHWELRAGEDDAYYVTVGFKEFRSAEIQAFLAGAKTHPALPAKENTRSLQASRDTLAGMATHYYGDPAKWRQIAAANGLTDVPPNVVLTEEVTGRRTITVPVVLTTREGTGQHR